MIALLKDSKHDRIIKPTSTSSVERVKLKQELLAYGFLRENVSLVKFPETLIPIIISFINCILDLVYDKSIHQGRYTWYSDKKIELKHFLYEEGMGSVALIDQTFNKELCRNFRIDLRITWQDKKPEIDGSRSDSWLRSRQHVTSPAFRIGYLTKLNEEMRQNLKEKIRYENLGNAGADDTYGIYIDKAGIGMYHNARFSEKKNETKFDKELEQEDVISLFFSFESYTSAIYHNYEKVGDCFEHKSEEIVNIYPAISMWSWEGRAMVARVEIMKCIINVEE